VPFDNLGFNSWDSDMLPVKVLLIVSNFGIYIPGNNGGEAKGPKTAVATVCSSDGINRKDLC